MMAVFVTNANYSNGLLFGRYTYCVSFSALIIVAGDLTAYWGLSTSWKALTYAAAPWVLLAINAAPVNVSFLQILWIL